MYLKSGCYKSMSNLKNKLRLVGPCKARAIIMLWNFVLRKVLRKMRNMTPQNVKKWLVECLVFSKLQYNDKVSG